MTRDFNRWLFGVVIPIPLLLWGVYILLVSRRVNLTLHTRLPGGLGRGSMILEGWEAAAFAAILILGAILLHRIRFWYELYLSPPGFWKWYDQLLLYLCFPPLGFLAWRFVHSALFG